MDEWQHPFWSIGEGCPECGEHTLVFTEEVSQKIWFEEGRAVFDDVVADAPKSLECSLCGLVVATGKSMETLSGEQQATG